MLRKRGATSNKGPASVYTNLKRTVHRATLACRSLDTFKVQGMLGEVKRMLCGPTSASAVAVYQDVLTGSKYR